jgi:hypothetical protein
MSDIEEFHCLTQSISTAMENIAQAVPQWREALGALADLTPGAMRYQGAEGSSGTAWDQVAADLELDRLVAPRASHCDVMRP